MSKEIDFEFGRIIGATHYLPETDTFRDGWMMLAGGEIMVTVFGEQWVSRLPYDDRVPVEIPSLHQWTIHNNTLPLRELSDEQYGKLRRAADTGGVVEFLDAEGDWCYTSEPVWNESATYRIKPKSERDEFVEKCVDVVAGLLDGYSTASTLALSQAMFDAGCRFVETSK